MKHQGLIYNSPLSFSLPQRLALACVPPLVANVYRLLYLSCRRESRAPEALTNALNCSGRVILAFWHEVLGLAACRFRNIGYHTLTSYSFDGEFATRVANSLGIEAVRGSSSRGGLHAIHQLLVALEAGEVLTLTVDGPKGPRRTAKPGAALMAVRSGVPIVPVAFAARPAWRLRSWDKMVIPKPFGRILCSFGQPLYPPRDWSRDAVETLRMQLEQALNAMHAELEQDTDRLTA